ncbi:MAG: phage tail protein [Acidobacteria bacterium]|nr:phage tail protein [Acidobacteriota bacterium]
MGLPYVGEIRMFAGNFAPAGWMFCEGQLIPISEYETLFNLIGTTYGGDGQSTFALPDLRGRVPIHQGTGPGLPTYIIGEAAGVEQVTLTVQQIPAHSHPAGCSSNPGNNSSPLNAVPAANTTALVYVNVAAPLQPMNAASIQSTGGNQPHENLQPYLCVDFIISMFGVFPSPT